MRNIFRNLALTGVFAALVGCGTIPQGKPVAAPEPAPSAARNVVIPTSTAETDATGRYVNAGILTIGGATPAQEPVSMEYVYNRENPAFGMPDAALLALGYFQHNDGKRDIVLEGVVIDSKTRTVADEYTCIAAAGSPNVAAAAEAFRSQVPDFNHPPAVVVLPKADLQRLCSHGKTGLITEQARLRKPSAALTTSTQ